MNQIMKERLEIDEEDLKKDDKNKKQKKISLVCIIFQGVSSKKISKK